MRFIDQSERSEAWDKYVNSKQPPTVWDKASGGKKHQLHTHLHKQQKDLCIYCEQKIAVLKNTANAIGSSHIEHVLPKSDARYQHLTFEQSNLAMSCLGFRDTGQFQRDANGRYVAAQPFTHEFCGHPKGNTLDETLFINPLQNTETSDYFSFDINGKVKPSKKNVAMADYTIQLLKLNHDVLVEWRKQIYEISTEDAYFDINEYPSFYTMLKELL